MNKLTRRAAAAVLCGALAVTACSCGANTTTALTIDGTEIPAGVYICYQMDALSEAQSVLAEEQPDLDMTAEGFDFKKQTIGGVAAEEWVKNKTVELCRNYVAANKAFDEYGLSLEASQKNEIKASVNSAWEEENMYAQYLYGFDTIGEYYESNADHMTPTCTEGVICSYCNEMVKEPLGHSLVQHAERPATCTDSGWDAYATCNRCPRVTSG